MWHCGQHFSHIIMHEKREEHQLVTTGIYRSAYAGSCMCYI